MRAHLPSRRLFVASLVAALLGTGCAMRSAGLSAPQRQQLETRVVEAPVTTTFHAARDAILNLGYRVQSSDFQGGVLVFTGEIPGKDPVLAAGLSTLAPIGDLYVGRTKRAAIDTVFWPVAWIWAAPSNYHAAKKDRIAVHGTLTTQRLGETRTRTRVTLSGVPQGAESYPLIIRSLYEEIERQVFLRAADPR